MVVFRQENARDGFAVLVTRHDSSEFMAMQSLRWLLMGIVKVHQLAASHATLII